VPVRLGRSLTRRTARSETAELARKDTTQSAAAQPAPGATHASRGAGTAAALAAFLLWGILPVYWKGLQGVEAVEVIAHRVVWSFLFLLVVLPLRGLFRQFLEALHTPRLSGLHLLSGLLLSVNWLTYVWAVSTAQIVESSLGYFLNPLFNVLLGFVVLRERLRPVQWAAVALAAAGVSVQLVQHGRLPWIALVLATSFAVYGLLRKQSPLGPLTGLGVETALVFPLALAFLVSRELASTGAFGHVGAGQNLLLAGTGVVTAVPLLFFAVGARALPLATVGLLQYVAPSAQFALGVFAYGEPFGGARVISFGLIWAGLVVFTADGLRRGFRGARAR
jgi:chloramphenicol-sensitive protein RarD